MGLNEVWKTGQRGLPVFINSLNAIQMFHAFPVLTKSAHVSAKWQNIASLKWYTLTQARTWVRTPSLCCTLTKVWSKNVSSSGCIYCVFCCLCLSATPMKMSNISLFFTYFCMAAPVMDELLFIDVTWRYRVPRGETGWSLYLQLNLC